MWEILQLELSSCCTPENSYRGETYECNLNVGNHSAAILIVSHQELILERNLIDVISVGNPLARAMSLLCIRELILERSLMSAISVESHSDRATNLSHIKELILERSPMNVINVGKSFIQSYKLCPSKNSYWRKPL